MDPNYPHGVNAARQGGHINHSYHHGVHGLPRVQSHAEDVSPGLNTLPPIQPQRQPISQAPASFEQLPRRQTYPSSYATALPTPVYTSQAPYSNGVVHYPNGSSLLPQPNQMVSLVPEYGNVSSQGGYPYLRPMHPAGNAPNQTDPSSFASSAALSDSGANSAQDSQTRTHVVGSQGRRGILPSDEGRPPAIKGSGSSSAQAGAAPTPTKDGNGKYPCPHCTKEYLHAKHLKRHLLRHTGTRPYSCILCNDTFSRSDILKRHFQKCSLRRGNPTGATHLSNSQSHLKKQAAAAKKESAASGLNSSFSGASQPKTSYAPMTLNENDLTLGLNASSVNRDPTGRFVNGTVNSGCDPSGQFNQTNTGHIHDHDGGTSLSSSRGSSPRTFKEMNRLSQTFSPDSAHQRSNAGVSDMTLPGDRASVPQAQNMSRLGQQTFQQWASLPGGRPSDIPVQKSEHEGVPNSYSISQEPQEEYVSSFFASRGGTNNPDGQNGWNMLDSFQTKAERLTTFCQLDDLNDPDDRLLMCYLTGDNVEHFLNHFKIFNTHWPYIHLSTLDLTETYDGLVLAMFCAGAVYSDRIEHAQVRVILRKSKEIIERSSEITKMLQGRRLSQVELETLNPLIMEQLEAITLIDAVSLWHGDDSQREDVMNGFGKVIQLARHMNYFEPAQIGSPSYSVLHQPGPVEDIRLDDWDWTSWLWQEKRIRFAMHWLLLDTALVLYFDCQPNLDPAEVKLPLPTDDAAWDASTATDCAAALGFNGPEVQRQVNTSGSRRKKQLELNLTLHALYHPTYEFPLRSTNVQSKFIIIHCIISQICKIQWQRTTDLSGGFGSLEPSSSLIQSSDWVTSTGSGRSSFSNSGSATPTDSSKSPQFTSVNIAVTKWKKIWDEDTPLQYPSGVSRVGFCRDGEHFFWIARLLLHNQQRLDVHSSWKQRFDFIMKSLKQIKHWVATQQASRGDPITGAVGEIDENYGVEDLTLDMKLLFKPLSPAYSPPSAVSYPAMPQREQASWPADL